VKEVAVRVPFAQDQHIEIAGLRVLDLGGRFVRLLIVGLVIAMSSVVHADQPKKDHTRAVQHLSDYLQIDTVNPPGNESLHLVEAISGPCSKVATSQESCC
jgi:hypothetical protein